MPPDYLYKYMPLRDPLEEVQLRLEARLTSPQLWFSAPSSFNDPMDCKPRFRLDGGNPDDRERFRRITIMHMIRQDQPHANGNELAKLVAEYQKKYPVFDASFLEAAHSALAKELRNVGVVCFSQCERDPVMFYHYGDMHRGMCLKFRCSDFFAHANPVQYSLDYPVVDFFDDGNKQEQFDKIFLTKYLGWSYEHEWRVVNPNQEPQFRSQPYQADLLEGLIFGYQMSQEDRDHAANLLRQRGHPVKLYEAKVSEVHYLLDIIPCGEVRPVE